MTNTLNHTVKVYSRDIDYSNGTETLIVDERGIVVSQNVSGKHSAEYTQSRSFLGKKIQELRGFGFRKQRISDEKYLDILADQSEM